MGNYPQEASGYGPQRVNQGYNQQGGYNQPQGMSKPWSLEYFGNSKIM